jgi:hypothetical protein
MNTDRFSEMFEIRELKNWQLDALIIIKKFMVHMAYVHLQEFYTFLNSVV